MDPSPCMASPSISSCPSAPSVPPCVHQPAPPLPLLQPRPTSSPAPPATLAADASSRPPSWCRRNRAGASQNQARGRADRGGAALAGASERQMVRNWRRSRAEMVRSRPTS
ncbi:hypothetical protein SEVIR_7G280825v4 [Setaria viridis]